MRHGMLNGLDLFSGIGGNALALSPWVRPVCYVEVEPYCQAVLIERMYEGRIPLAPLWDDVRTFSRAEIEAPIDIIVAGFPCQDISVAGRGAGLDGERSGLFFEVERLVREFTPAFVFLENVPAIRTRGGEVVGKRLAALGYDCRWDTLSAADVGAPHKRERWFLLGYAKHDGYIGAPNARGNAATPRMSSAQGPDTFGKPPRAGRLPVNVADANRFHDQSKQRGMDCSSFTQWEQIRRHGPDGSCPNMANSNRAGLEIGQSKRSHHGTQCSPSLGTDGWDAQSKLGRVVDGLPNWLDRALEGGVPRVAPSAPGRKDRIHGLGNAVVPAQAREAFRRLSGL